jgi:hypothetical protein
LRRRFLQARMLRFRLRRPDTCCLSRCWAETVHTCIGQCPSLASPGSLLQLSLGRVNAAAADWEAELETERDCGGVREALPLRSGEGLPTGDAVRAAVGAPEEVPPSVAEPRPLKEAAGAV